MVCGLLHYMVWLCDVYVDDDVCHVGALVTHWSSAAASSKKGLTGVPRFATMSISLCITACSRASSISGSVRLDLS